MLYLKSFFLTFLLMLSRYFLIAGGAYYFFWKRDSAFTQKNRIQSIDFSASDLKREIRYSVQTSIIFGLVLGYSFQDRGGIGLNSHFLRTSGLYDFASFLVLLLIHDTYFYWMHRTLHFEKPYQWFHKVHHLSLNPSPWAAFSFHPAEAILEALWVVPVHGFLPIEDYIWAWFGTVILAINVMGHLGVEIYPRSWQRHPILKWLNFSTFHNKHHQYFTSNFGLYFSFWDRVMGTLK